MTYLRGELHIAAVNGILRQDCQLIFSSVLLFCSVSPDLFFFRCLLQICLSADH